MVDWYRLSGRLTAAEGVVPMVEVPMVEVPMVEVPMVEVLDLL